MQFKCQYCSRLLSTSFYGDNTGMVVPCDCTEARESRELEHYMRNERRKVQRRQDASSRRRRKNKDT